MVLTPFFLFPWTVGFALISWVIEMPPPEKAGTVQHSLPAGGCRRGCMVYGVRVI